MDETKKPSSEFETKPDAKMQTEPDVLREALRPVVGGWEKPDSLFIDVFSVFRPKAGPAFTLSGQADAPLKTGGGMTSRPQKKPPKTRVNPRFNWKKWRKILFLSVGLSALLLGLPVIGWFGYCAMDMPSTSALWSPKRTPEIVILDRHGREILRKGGTGITPIRLEDLPPSLINALVATEDKRFFHHPGFDPKGLLRAAWANHKAGRVVQGGSTLTQQLAKNIFLSRERTIKRKTQEIMLAVWLEIRMSKDEILESYLSRVYFGGGTVGIESGAKRFFNKSPSELSPPEAAFLVGLLKAPDRLNPLKNREASARRTAEVLGKMYAQGYLDADRYEKALTEPIEIEPVAVRKYAGAGYFTDWVLDTMDKKIGAPSKDVTIQTTIDIVLQSQAEQAIRHGLSTRRNVQQGALVSFDGTGAVLAMVGGADYQHSSFNRVIAAKRQPGSAFKPLVYLAALQAGHVPWEVWEDKEIDINGWKPGNYTGKYRGKMSLEKALALSINTIAVQLSEQVGRDTVVSTAHLMGIDGLKPYASLALGAQELSLFELSSAYIPFANWGYQAKPYGIDAIFAKDGTVIYEHSAPPRARILGQRVLSQMNMMLKTVVEKGTGRAARIPGRDIAGKTGTTNDYRDAWFIGYAPDMVTGVWVGNDDNSKMARVTGGSIPARIWKAYMQQALSDTPKALLPSARPPLKIQNRHTLDVLLADIEKGLPKTELPKTELTKTELTKTVAPKTALPNPAIPKN